MNTDEELIEQAAQLQLIYCDGFGAFRKVNGLLRAVGYVLQGGAVLNLAISLAGADAAQIEAQRVLHEREIAPSIAVWCGSKLGH